MRRFTIKFETPETCHCCGADLPQIEANITRGKYEFSVPEGPRETLLSLGAGLQLILGRKQLVVYLRPTSPQNEWELLPLFNTDAFSYPKRLGGPPGFTVFTFDLLPFRPCYNTWWAELKFAEVQPFNRLPSGQKAPAHNGATLSIKLDTLE